MQPVIFRQGSGRVVSSVLRFATGTLTQSAGEAVYTPPGGGGGGPWTSSGYTGTASRLAGFDGAGAAAYYTGSTALDLVATTRGMIPVRGAATWGGLTVGASAYLLGSNGTDPLWKSPSTVKTDLSLNNVENTALSTWAGSTNITTLGTIGTGTWQGTAIAMSYLSLTYGTTVGTVCQGNDSRLSDSRAPTGSAGGDLAGTYPNPTVSQARGLLESGGTTLTMGAVSAGQLLGRSGTTIAGVNASATPTAGYVVVANAGGKVDSWISTASTTVAGLLKLGASGGAQAWGAILDAIIALSSTGFIARTGAGTVAARTLTAGTGITIINGDGVSSNPTISMTGGSNTDRDATFAYTVDWYPQLSSFLADNGTLTQTGTTALIFDSNGNRVGRRTGSGAIYTTNLDTCIWGGAFTASIVVLTNTTALTGNVYKFGLTTSNTMTTALADAVQQVSVVYRQASGGNWRIITRNATTTTDTDSGVTVAVGTFYRIEIACAAGGASVTVTIKTGDINTWTSTTSVTVTATLPASNTYNGMYHYSGATSGTNTNYIYGAHFQQVFRTS